MKKLESTRKIPAGSILRIYKKGFGYTKFTLIDNSDYYFAGLVSEDFFESSQNGDFVEAYLWIEDVASYEFTSQIIGRIVTVPHLLFFGHTGQIRHSSERKCLTAVVDMPIKFFYFDPGETHKGISSIDIVTHTGRIILLTDREATIKCDGDHYTDRFLKGHLRIGEEDIEILGKVEEVNPPKKIINVRFSGMRDEDRIKILDYVFSHYRE